MITIDETSIQQDGATISGWSAIGLSGSTWNWCGVLSEIVTGIDSEMTPILKLDWSKVNIECRAVRAINDHGT